MSKIPETLSFCSLDELREKRIITRWVEEWRDELSALWEDGNPVVVSSICPHFGGPFEYLEERSTLRCKWHAWEFDVSNGECVSYKCKTKLLHYKHEESNGHIVVNRP